MKLGKRKFDARDGGRVNARGYGLGWVIDLLHYYQKVH